VSFRNVGFTRPVVPPTFPSSSSAVVGTVTTPISIVFSVICPSNPSFNVSSAVCIASSKLISSLYLQTKAQGMSMYEQKITFFSWRTASQGTSSHWSYFYQSRLPSMPRKSRRDQPDRVSVRGSHRIPRQAVKLRMAAHHYVTKSFI
jgi:hypothetical protein